MGLRGALVDKARTLGKTSDGERIEGTIYRTNVTGPWFRCRFEPSPQTENRDDARVRVSAGASMIVSTADLDGTPLDIHSDDRIEVDSVQLGTNVFLVLGDPEPLRKKRRVVGYRISLARVID